MTRERQSLQTQCSGVGSGPSNGRGPLPSRLESLTTKLGLSGALLAKARTSLRQCVGSNSWVWRQDQWLGREGRVGGGVTF